MAIIHAKKEDFDKIIKSHSMILLNFWTERCTPCRCLLPVLEQFAEVEKDKIRVVKVNIGKECELAKRFEIKGIPNSLAIIDGEIKDATTKMNSCEELREWFRSFIL